MCVYVHVHTAMWSLYSSQQQKRGGNRMVGEVISSERSATETIYLISHNSLCRQDILLRNLGVMNCTLKANKRYQKSSFFLWACVLNHITRHLTDTNGALMLLRHPSVSHVALWQTSNALQKGLGHGDYRHHGNISATHCDVTSGQGGAVEGILRAKTNF